VPVIVNQRLHRRIIEHLLAVAPLQAQFAAVDLPLDAQPVGQQRVFVLCQPGTFSGRGEQRLLVKLTVELPHVVEGDARRGQTRQLRAHLITCQVAQQAVTDALVRNTAQLLLDRFDRGAEVTLRSQLYREQAGKPAQGARQIEVIEQLFSTVAFELNQAAGLPTPAANHPCQRRQQQIVDLGAIGCRGHLQQLAGKFGIEFELQLAPVAVLQTRVRTVTGQVAAGTGQLRLPPGQLIDPCQSLALQACSPGLIGTGLGLRRLARSAIKLLQIFQQYTPRYAVHHQVMDHQQQALTVIGHVHQQRAQQRALLQVKAALSLFA